MVMDVVVVVGGWECFKKVPLYPLSSPSSFSPSSSFSFMSVPSSLGTSLPEIGALVRVQGAAVGSDPSVILGGHCFPGPLRAP